MIARRSVKVLVLASVFAGGFAHAQNINIPIRPAYSFPVSSTASSGPAPANIRLGESPIFLTPYLGLGVGYDDNLFLSASNEKSSSYYVVSPGFRLDARDANKVASVSYQGTIGRYGQSEDDNYVDHALRASFDMAFGRSAFLRLNGDYIRGHDPRGSTDRALAGSPDKYRLSTPGVTFAYGTPGADGRVELYYSDATKRYTNNRSTTTGSDRDTQEYGAAFYWRVMPRTYVMVEGRQTDLSYKLPNSPFSGEEQRFYAGLMWEATAATTGTVKVGQLRKRFDLGFPTYEGAAWEALITWSPRTYSKFDFYSGRYPTESTGLGRFIISEAAGVNWNHAWSTYFSTEASLRFQKDEYQGFSRNDDVTAIGLRAGYRLRRWLTLGAEYTFTKRESNSSVFDYDKNLYLLTATITM
jgi:polysaccharide biosynthesis protein VpsM